MAWSTLEDTQLSFHDPREKAIPAIGLNPTSLVATAQRLSEYLQSPADTRGKFVNLGSGNEYLASNVVQALKEALRSLDGARTQAYGAETGRGQVSFEQFVMRFARGKNDFNELALAICNGINQLVNSGIFVVSPEQEFMAQAGRIQQERIKELQAEMAAKENLLTDQAQKTGAFADQMEKVRQFHLDRILKEGKPLAPSDQSQLIQEVSQGIEEYKIEVGKEVRELIETQEREIQKYVSATAKSHQIVDVQQQVALEKLCKEAVALASQQKASGTKIDISSLNSEVVSNAQLRNVVHGRELAELNSVVNSIFEKVDPRTTVTAKNIQDKARKATAGAVRQALVKESVGNIGKQQNLAPETQLRAIGIASAQELAVRSLGENLAAVVGSAYERAAAQSLKGEAINIDPALRAYIGEAKAKNLQIQVQQALDGAGREGANLFLQASSGVDNDPNIAASHAILRDNISALAARDNINPTVVAAASALTNLNLEASRRIITEVEAVATTPLAPDIQTKIKDLYLRASDMAVSQVAKGGRSIDLSDLVKEAKNDPVLRSHLTDAHFQSIQDAVVKTYIDADNAPIILIDRARSRVPTDIGAKIESVSQKRVERFYQPDLNIYKQVRNSLVKQAAEVEKLTTRYTQDPKTAAAVKEIYAGGMELAAKQISTGKAVDLSALKNSVDEGSPLSAYVRSEQIASLEDIAKKTYINPDIAAEVIQINDLASVTAGLDKQVAVVSALTTSAITELPGFKTLRESATSPEVVEQIQRLNESLVDVTTRQAAAGYEKLDLQDIYEQVSLQKVGEYVSPQYLAKATEEMQKLFDDPAFRQQALAVVNARQMLAPDIASVYEVFEGLVDPRGILSPEIRAQRALEASYKFAKASMIYDYREAMWQALGVDQVEIIQSGVATNLRETLVQAKLIQLPPGEKQDYILRTGDEFLKKMRDSELVLAAYHRDGRYNLFTADGVLDVDLAREWMETNMKLVLAGEAPIDPHFFEFLALTGDKSQEVLDAVFVQDAQATFKRLGIRLDSRSIAGLSGAQLKELKEQLPEHMAERLSYLGAEFDGTRSKLERYAPAVYRRFYDLSEGKRELQGRITDELKRRTSFVMPVIDKYRAGTDKLYGLIDQAKLKVRSVVYGKIGAPIQALKYKVVRGVRRKVGYFLVSSGRKLLLKYGTKGLRGLAGKGLIKLGLAFGGKGLAALGINAIPVVGQVISFALAAKMYYDLLKEMPLAGAVIKTTKKHFLPALTAGVVGGLWLLNAAWAFMVGKFAALASTVGYGMIGLGVATFNPFLIGGGLILNAPQIAALSKALGSQISTLAGNFSSAVGSYLSGNLSATTTLVAGGTLGAVAITQMILQQNLTSAFMLPPFDETNALLAEVADYACADDDGNPYEIPPGLGGRWPMGEGIVLNGVGAITNDGYVHKNAVDIISDEGVEVRATHTGTIGKVQYKDLTPKKGTGINVDIDYRDASGRRIYTTRYSHLLSVGLNPNTQLQWAVRDQINEGDLVGWVGNTGNSSQAHLHYEILNQIVTYNKVGVGCTLPGLSDKQKEDINNGCDASGGTLLCNFQVP